MDQTQALTEAVQGAANTHRPLRLVGGGTHEFYGRAVDGKTLSIAGHKGIIDYDPSELVITARAGTLVSEIEALLAENQQMLAFEPPRFGPSATLGGAVATGLSGPRRPFAGALRDFVLGARILDGRGQSLHFGGTVFKNVAGFDAFRLMAGAQGGLGLILDVSLRVTPKPRSERALVLDLGSEAARLRVVDMMRHPLPLSGAFHDGERLHLRLSGGEAAVTGLARDLGGEDEPMAVWQDIANLAHPALAGDGPLWRIAIGQTRIAPADWGPVWDWAGGVRWIRQEIDAPNLWDAAAALGGHATLFRGPRDQVFQSLAPAVRRLHERLKTAMDPFGIFNPGRLYEGF